MPRPSFRTVLRAGVLLGLLGCRPNVGDTTKRPERPVVVVAVGEPAGLLPVLAAETVARDIGDLVYQRLADLIPGHAPIDPSAYRPALAIGWERLDSLTWRFHLARTARWADGEPVTAEDVRFSFDAFGDSALGAPAPALLSGRIRVLVDDSHTVRIVFSDAYPEQLYDATYYVRVIPRHIWEARPRRDWARDTSIALLVGSGPYRVREWKRGEYVRLEARGSQPIRSIIWRFADDPDAALNLVLSHEADLMELAAAPEGLERVARDTALRVIRYPSAAYGFLGFNLVGRTGGPHPVFGDRATRRALAMAIDRATLARSTFGPDAVAPPGPMSRLLWIWSEDIATLPYDTARAARALDATGWRRRGDGLRYWSGRPLAFDILVPSTSRVRRQLALEVQATLRNLGAKVTITTVDFPVFQERLARGRFDAYVGAWLDEPSPRGLADQWTRAGWAVQNYGRYANPVFDSLFARAARSPVAAVAGVLYRQALDTLNADAPAVFLYTPANAAAVSRRLTRVVIDPYSWLSGIEQWGLADTP